VEEYDGDDSDAHVHPISSSRLPPPRAKSSRPSAKRSYEQFADDAEEDDDQDMMDVDDDDAAEDDDNDRATGSSSLIDRILGHRKLPSTASTPSVLMPSPGYEDSYEYLIKWRGKSFLHTSWVTADYLRSQGVGGRARLLKYWKFRPVLPQPEVDEDEIAVTTEPTSSVFNFFPPEYVEVERVIAEKEEFELYEEPQDEQTLDIELVSAPPTTRKVKKYLVKWAGLPYSDASWESAPDLNDDEAIEKFKKRNLFPGPITYPPHPAATSFKRMPKSPLFKDGNELRSYQLEGLNWLAFNWYHRRGCILADEMGLGKTVQSITFLDFLFRNERIPGPFLGTPRLTFLLLERKIFSRSLSLYSDCSIIDDWALAARNRELDRYECDCVQRQQGDSTGYPRA
jgi:SNF2 family DNA or RNA helicase